MTLIFNLLTPKRERSFSGHGQYICEVSLLFAKSKWSCGAEMVKKFKVKIWPLTFWPKINRGPSRVKVNIYVKYHHCMPNGRGVIVQKPLFHRRTDMDRQTDSYGKSSIPPQLRVQTYFQCGEIVEKWPPWKSKFHGGSHFFTICGSKLMLKFEPCQLLTLKNDPGSHF